MSEFQQDLTPEQSLEFRDIEEDSLISILAEIITSAWDAHLLDLRLKVKQGEKNARIQMDQPKSFEARTHGLLKSHHRYSTFEVKIERHDDCEATATFEELDTASPRRASIQIADLGHTPFIVDNKTRQSLSVGQMLEIASTAHDATEMVVQDYMDRLIGLEDSPA